MKLSYYIENPSAIELHSFAFIFRSLGIQGLRSEQAEGAQVLYLEQEIELGNQVVLAFNKNKQDRIWRELIDGNVPTSGEPKVTFDLIHAIGFFLADLGNLTASANSYDLHGRLKFKESFQYKNGIGKIPILNQYILFLKAHLESKLETVLPGFYPEGKRVCIILSHDVDIPGKHDDFHYYPLRPKKFSPRAVYKHYRQGIALLKYYVSDKNKDEYWTFDELFAAERQRGFRSTNFFAVTNKRSPNGHPIDVAYPIDHPDFQPVFEQMKAEGFEIALHAGYNTREKTSHFTVEKEKLEQVAQTEVLGLRHHYWHMGKNFFPTLKKHEEAGFKYDSSLAFNDSLGFRFSAALPFFPFDSLTNEKIGVLQIPVLCMDGNLFYDKSMTTERAMETIHEYLDILEKYQGTGSIDWHTRTSYPKGSIYKKWGETYLQILDVLAQKDHVWVVTAEQLYAWWMDRIQE